MVDFRLAISENKSCQTFHQHFLTNDNKAMLGNLTKLLLLLLLTSHIFIYSCAVLVTKAAIFTRVVVGAGVYTYMNGQLSRLYQAPYDTTNQVCTATLKKLKIAITEETYGGINTTIKAKRTDGTPVFVKTEMVELRITKVSVRSGMVGVWDKNFSELIHVSIAQRLQK